MRDSLAAAVLAAVTARRRRRQRRLGPAGVQQARTRSSSSPSAPTAGEHWSTVWLVVIDGQVYIRLGSRAAGRIEKNTTKPDRQGAHRRPGLRQVKAEAVPDMAEPVAKAMGEKYWSDVLVRHFNPPADHAADAGSA